MLCLLLLGTDLAGEHFDFLDADERVPKIIFQLQDRVVLVLVVESARTTLRRGGVVNELASKMLSDAVGTLWQTEYVEGRVCLVPGNQW